MFEWSVKTAKGLVKKTTNLIEYMKIVYKKDITKPNQPLLFVNMRD